jgi:hypothetical protein
VSTAADVVPIAPAASSVEDNRHVMPYSDPDLSVRHVCVVCLAGTGVDKYFSIIALFIVFRETIEASLIVGVLLQFLSRSFPHLKKQGDHRHIISCHAVRIS